MRQAGSHVWLEHPGPPLHRMTVPLHTFLKVGTLSAIVGGVAEHLKIARASVLDP